MGGESILVVDDNAINSKLVRVLLAEEGYVVRTASDAEEAMRHLQTFHPDVILMDIQLPGMDGLELTRRLRASPEWAQVIVLALTAYAMKGDEAKALAAGCDGYITKPIDLDALLASIADHLTKLGTRGRLDR